MATIQLKRDTSANWTAANPTLALAEPGLETDTNRIKYGDGVTSWQNLHYASNVAFREVSFPNGVAGDTAGTIVVNGAGKTFICTSTYSAQEPTGYTLTTSETVLNGQNINGNLAFTFNVSDNPTLAGWLYNIAVASGTVTLTSPVLEGTRTSAVGTMNYDTNHVTFSIQVPYVSGDPTEIDSGTTFVVTVTPPQPIIWDAIGDTGNIKFNGYNISTVTDQHINIQVNSSAGDDTELDLHTNTIDLYTYNGSAGAELYLDNSDHAHPYAYIGVQPTGSNEQTWTFNKDGNIIFPDQTVQTTAYPGPTVTDPTVWAVQAVSSTKQSLTQAVAYDSQGNTFALIYQGPWSGPGETRSSIVKLSNHGDTVWTKDLYNNDSVNPWSLCCDANNDVYAVVQINVGSNVYNNTLVKISGSDGSILWQVDIHDSHQANNMQAVPMVYSSGGNSFNGVVVAGSAYNITDSADDFFIAFIGTDGNTSAPTSTFGDQYEQAAYSLAVNNSTGDILLVGVKESNTDAHYYLEMVKFNVTSPTAIWQKQVSVTGNNYDVKGTDCCLLADGNWAILATHDASSTYGIITMKVSNTDGSVMWSREVGQGCANVSSSMTTGADGHIYISATTFNNNSNGGNAGIPQTSRLVAAYDTSGTSLWQKFFGAPGSNSLIDNNGWNSPGATGKVLALNGTNLLIGASIIVLAPYPTNSIGVMAQITTSGDNQVIGPFELTNSALSGAPVTLTVTDTTFGFTTSTQTLAAGDTVSVTASTLDYTLFHSGIRPNQLAVGTKTVTLQSNGTLVTDTGRNITGELVQNTDSSNNFSNVPVGIKNASGYKRLVGASSTAQVWLDLSDVGTQLGINPNWINGMIIDYQVLSSNIGNTGSMTGQIIIASNENYAMNVSHIESAITESNSQSDVVFANLNIWQPYNGTLRAYRTDSISTQQLDFIWTAKVFYNASEQYC